MYEAYWGLAQRPFREHPDPDVFVRTDSHHAAILKLRYLIEHRLGLGVLAGDVGMGKSTVAAVLQRDLPDAHRPLIFVHYPCLTSTELLSYLAVELGADTVGESTRAAGNDEVVRQIQRQLLRHNESGRVPAIFVDEAHLIENPETLQSLRLLLNFRQPPHVDFSMVLIGDLTLLPQIQRMAALDDRVAVKCLLQPLSLADTEDYVSRRLAASGASRPLFDDKAIRAVHELSGGVPRRINRLCDLALLVGYADSLSQLTEREIDAVAEELISVVPD